MASARTMQFGRVVDAYEKIEATTKRLEMTELLVGLLRDTPKEDLDKVVYLTQGRIHPDYEGVELGLAEKMVMRVLAHATGLEDGPSAGRARVQRIVRPRGGRAGPRLERHRRPQRHPPETLPPDPRDARRTTRDARGDLRADGGGRARVQVRRAARPSPRLSEE